MKVRANLAATHIGPETLEEAVQDYINRNTDLCDLTGMVAVSIVPSIQFIDQSITLLEVL